jgi:hypothetical protein
LGGQGFSPAPPIFSAGSPAVPHRERITASPMPTFLFQKTEKSPTMIPAHAGKLFHNEKYVSKLVANETDETTQIRRR